MLPGEYPVGNPVQDRQSLLLDNQDPSSRNDTHYQAYNFNVREDSEYGAAWPQLDENLTPQEALRTKFFKINWFVSSLLPLLINMGLAFASNHSYSHMGLVLNSSANDEGWDVPSTNCAFLDIGLTAFLLIFFTSAFARKPIQKGVENAKIGPLNDLELATGFLRMCPSLRIRNHLFRSFLLAIQLGALVVPITLLVLFGMCAGGAMDGPEKDVNNCYFSMVPYIMFKSLWAGALAAAIYPLVFIASLNRAALSTEQYQQYLTKRHDILESQGHSLPVPTNATPTIAPLAWPHSPVASRISLQPSSRQRAAASGGYQSFVDTE